MRRETRKKEEMDTKIIKLASIGVSILAVIVIALLIYGSKLNKEVKDGSLSSEQLASLVNKTPDNLENTERTSTEMGKTVEEAKKEENQTENSSKNSTTNTNTTTNSVKENTNKNSNTTNSLNKKDNTSTTNNSTKQTTAQASKNSTDSKNSTANETSKNDTKETSKELAFQKPVEGEIIKEFAKDNLLFSQTLQEWTVHTGIDIKAEKTTVVKSAEAGTVKSIKNDPRYGLTIVVSHDNGFETVYSNLLTSEFVVEGEKVDKGQSLGTVGNTAAFEVADDSHLHFEILKDSVQVDPSIYIK